MLDLEQLVPFYDQLRSYTKQRAAWESLELMKSWTMYMAQSFECVFEKKADYLGEHEFGTVYITIRPNDILIVDPATHVHLSLPFLFHSVGFFRVTGRFVNN